MNVSAPDTVTSGLPATDGLTVTAPEGCVSSTTVKVAAPPSGTVNASVDTAMPRMSSSSIVTVAGVTSRPGAAPATRTVSSSSSMASSTGVSVKLAVPEVSPASMVSVKS